ncbi:DeoR/GlpR family DNA-binding transcription regulator [Yersinia entomophaga]
MPRLDNVRMKQQLMLCSEKSYLIAEGIKFNKFSFHKVADLTQFDGVITDGAIPKKTIDMSISKNTEIDLIEI